MAGFFFASQCFFLCSITSSSDSAISLALIFLEFQMTFSKLTNFSSLAVCSAIEPYLNKVRVHASVLDTAYETPDSVYMARVVTDEYCDLSSEDALQIKTYRERNKDMGVYVSPRRISIFNADLEDVVDLFKSGFKVYPVEEYQHSATSVRLAGNAITSAKEIRTGSFRQGINLHCRWDSSFAFIAVPKSWKKPSPEFFREFTSWLNGECYSIEILKATDTGLNEDGDTVFSIEEIETCSGFYSTESAEAEAISTLESVCKRAEMQPA